MESKGKLVPKNERILRAAEAVFSKKGYRQATWMKRSSFSSIVSFMAIATKRGSTWCTNETSKEAFLRDGLFFVFCSSRQGQYDILQV